MLLGDIAPCQVDVMAGHLQCRMAQDLLEAERVAAIADVEYGTVMLPVSCPVFFSVGLIESQPALFSELAT